MEHSNTLLLHAIYYLLAAIIAVPLFRKLGLGAILGYLCAGAVIGPQILGLIGHPEAAMHFAEFGVIMMLFVIGLELNPDKLWRMRGDIGLLGGSQLLLSTIAITICLLPFVSWQLAITLGLTLGLSSTAFAIQLMNEQGVMAGPLGRKGFAILLLQDLAVIPILLLVSLLAPVQPTADHSSAWWVGVLVICGVLVGGRYLLGPALRIIAQYGSREVFTAATLLIVLGTAWLMQIAGLTMGIGAFIAGILLANSSFRHQLETDIEPFKGLLLGLFFIAVGMSLDIAQLLARPWLILGLALALMLGKMLIIAIAIRLSGEQWRCGFLLGLMLSQGGEFAFVVMASASQLNLITAPLSNLVILVVGTSMVLTIPMLLLFKKLTAYNSGGQDRPYETEAMHDSPEVVIAGFGRFGQIIGRILTAKNLRYTALDKDADHIAFVEKFGNKVFYGDATRGDLLDKAGIQTARILVIAVDDIEHSVEIARYASKNCPNLHIIARAHNRAHAYQLLQLGIIDVIRETFDSSLEAAELTLTQLGYTQSQASTIVRRFREHDERAMRDSAEHKDDLSKLIKIAAEGRRELEDLYKSDKE